MSERKFNYTFINNSNKTSGSVTSSLKRPENLTNSVINNITENDKLKYPIFSRLGRFNNLSFNNKYYYKEPDFYNKENLKTQIDVLLTSLNDPNSLKNKNIINIKRKEKSTNSLTTEGNTFFDSKKDTIDTFLPVLNANTKTNNNTTKSKILANDKNLSFSKITTQKPKNFINKKQNSFCVENNFNKKYNIKLTNQTNNDVKYLYKNIFTSQPIFHKKKNQYLDNKLNLVYSENEEQYKIIMKRRNKSLKNKNIIPKAGDDAEKIIQKVKVIKSKIKFMKCVMDYSYPDFILTKAKAMVKQLSNENVCKNKLTPLEIRNVEAKNKMYMRTNYLKQSLNVAPLKLGNN